MESIGKELKQFDFTADERITLENLLHNYTPDYWLVRVWFGGVKSRRIQQHLEKQGSLSKHDC